MEEVNGLKSQNYNMLGNDTTFFCMPGCSLVIKFFFVFFFLVDSPDTVMEVLSEVEVVERSMVEGDIKEDVEMEDGSGEQPEKIRRI